MTPYSDDCLQYLEEESVISARNHDENQNSSFQQIMPNADTVSCSFDAVKTSLLNAAKKEIKFALKNMRSQLNISSSVTPDISSILNVFLCPKFIIDMNEMLRKSGCNMDMDDLQKCIRLVYALSALHLSVDLFYDSPPFLSSINIPNTPSKQVFLRFLHGLSFIRNRTSDHELLTFGSVKAFEPILKEAARDLSIASSSIFFQKGTTILSCDDDQLQIRSSLAAETGFTRKHNPKKRYGPQNDVLCSFGVGAVLASNVISSQESESSSFKYLLQLAHQNIESFELGPFNSPIALDRGFSGPTNLESCHALHLNHIGGIKSNAAHFTEKLKVKSKIEQILVPKDGFSVSYFGKTVHGKDSKKFDCVEMCFRTGTGRLVHIQSSPNFGELKIDPHRYEYEFAHKDYLPTSRSDRIASGDALFVELEDNFQSLTLDQRTPDWFILRCFGLSGTTCGMAIQAYKKHFAEEFQPLLTHLHIRVEPDAAPVVKHYSDDEISKLKSPEIKQLLKKNRITIPDNVTQKKALETLLRNHLDEHINAIGQPKTYTVRSTPLPYVCPKQSVRDLLLKSWFYNGHGTNDNCYVGSENESKVIEMLEPFLVTHLQATEIKTKQYGLIEVEQGITVSPDTILQMKLPDEELPRMYAVEIKTKVSSTTSMATFAMRNELYQSDEHNEFNPIFRLQFGTDECKRILQDHRFQVIHLAMVCGVRDVLYTVAGVDQIIFIAHVTFDENMLTKYKIMVRTLLDECVPWIRNNDENHLPEITKPIAGCVDTYTLVQTFFLFKQIRDKVVERKRPLPSASRIVPMQIVIWNNTKGMTDTFSRCLVNTYPSLQQKNPILSVWLRLVLTGAYDTHLGYRLFQIEKELDEIDNLQDLRTKLCHISSFKESVMQLALTSFPNILRSNLNSSIPVLVPTSSDYPVLQSFLDENSRNQRKAQYLDLDEGRRRRTDVRLHHHHESSGSQCRCVLCGCKTFFYCMGCSTDTVKFYYCTVTYNPRTKKEIQSCHEKCHKAVRLSTISIPNRTIDMPPIADDSIPNRTIDMTTIADDDNTSSIRRKKRKQATSTPIDHTSMNLISPLEIDSNSQESTTKSASATNASVSDRRRSTNSKRNRAARKSVDDIEDTGSNEGRKRNTSVVAQTEEKSITAISPLENGSESQTSETNTSLPTNAGGIFGISVRKMLFGKGVEK
jgi:hypothetical protein